LVKLAVDKDPKVSLEACEAIEKYGERFLEKADEESRKKVINLAMNIVKLNIDGYGHAIYSHVRYGAVKIIEAFKLDLLPELAVLCFDNSRYVSESASEAWRKIVGVNHKEWFRNATEEQKKRVIEIVKANIKSDDYELNINAINCIKEFEIKSLLPDLELLWAASKDHIVSEKAGEVLVKLRGMEKLKEVKNTNCKNHPL
jgi:hypothetical protein